MSKLPGFPRLCLDVMTVREHLNVLGNARLQGTTRVDGPLKVYGSMEINGPLTIAGDKTVNVPSPQYPTIQSAIDFFNGRHAQDGVIKLTKGQYIEDLEISKIASSLPENKNDTSKGFSIIGDERDVAGFSYIHNIELANDNGFAGLGTGGDTIALASGANTITVGGSDVDFGVAGVEVDDHIKIRDNSGVWSTHKVTLVAGDTLTYDGASATVGGAYPVGFCSALTICPNVEILPASGLRMGAFTVLGGAVSLKGLWLNLDLSRGAAFGLVSNLYVTGHTTHVNTNNCLYDDSEFNSFFTNILNELGTVTNMTDPFNGVYTPNTTIGGGYYSDAGICHFIGGFSYEGGFQVDYNGKIDADGYQVVAAFQAFGCTSGTANVNGYAIGCVRGCVFFGTNGQANRVTIDCSSDGITAIPGSVGFRCGNSAGLFLAGDVSNATIGCILRGASKAVRSGNGSGYINCDIDVVRTAESEYEDRNLDPLSVHQYLLASGVMDSNYSSQSLVGAPGAVALTMDPAADSTRPFPDNITLYQGKEFTLMDSTGAAHTLTLPGAFFIGAGSGTVATFGGAIGDFIKLKVMSATQVLVLSLNGVSIA